MDHESFQSRLRNLSPADQVEILYGGSLKPVSDILPAGDQPFVPLANSTYFQAAAEGYAAYWTGDVTDLPGTGTVAEGSGNVAAAITSRYVLNQFRRYSVFIDAYVLDVTGTSLSVAIGGKIFKWDSTLQALTADGVSTGSTTMVNATYETWRFDVMPDNTVVWLRNGVRLAGIDLPAAWTGAITLASYGLGDVGDICRFTNFKINQFCGATIVVIAVPR